jgi:hypothetical protein
MNALAPLFGGDVRAANAYYRDKVQPTAEFLPGIGDVMAAGEAKDAYDQGNYGMAGLLGVGAAAGLVPGVGDAVQKGVKRGIRAYHGSPHDFDKFSLDKIGTGEGAQAYGHGLYFAESEGVAKSYRDDLSKSAYSNPNRTAHRAMFADAVPANQEVADRIVDLINQHNKTPEEAVRLVGIGKNKEYVEQNQEALTKVANNIKSALDNPNPGRMYEVNINANPEDFLDWDKPLSEQPESVRNAIISSGGMGDAGVYQLDDRWVFHKPGDWGHAQSQEDAMSALFSTATGADVVPKSNEALVKLREAGIPGIKYLDAGSRGAGDGSRNYVVFDDSLIEILRKYGILPAAVGTGAFMQMMEDDPERAQELHNYATSIRDGA